MRRRQAGLTLLEVMVVVAIVGIFAALSVVGFQGMVERQRVSGAQRELLMVAQDARQKARSTRQPVRLNVWTVVDANGVELTRLRWEALPCTDAWGSTCPIPACETNACGSGGCNCTDVGEPVIVPRGLNIDSVDGLCWLGTQEFDVNSRAVVARSGGRECNAANPIPAAGNLVMRRNQGTAQNPQWRTDLVMEVDGLTGSVRSVDCEKNPTAPGCA
jgi:prepilin-type N-terminal cleavage/methylation domain-containing protein